MLNHGERVAFVPRRLARQYKDEGFEFLYKRKAMSALNVDLVSEVLPEVSKAHVRVLLLTQIDKLARDAIDAAFSYARPKTFSIRY